METRKIDAATVRADFNDLPAVVHYTRAAHELGLWDSERRLIERFFPDRGTPLLEAGCGAGRVTLGLWELGYRSLVAFDFAEELVDQARSLAAERHATAITFLHADATRLPAGLCHSLDDKSPAPGAVGAAGAVGATGAAGAAGAAKTAGAKGTAGTTEAAGTAGDAQAAGVAGIAGDEEAKVGEGVGAREGERRFGGVLFMFNGLMQIPGRGNRRAALQELHRVCAPGAPLLFTTHDRDGSPAERALWRLETLRWVRGAQDPRLVEFGDRYFEDEAGRTFMHLPDRREILEDLAETGWRHAFDAMRTEVARESRAVREFSDECRFWAARRA